MQTILQQDRFDTIHAAAGQLHCAMCSRPAPDYHTLAQHMKDKHGHDSHARDPMSVTLSDLLQASRYGYATRMAMHHFLASAAGGLRLSLGYAGNHQIACRSECLFGLSIILLIVCTCCCSIRPNATKPMGQMVPRLTSKQMQGVKGLLKVFAAASLRKFPVN